eukprot:6187150-Prymnesium_polylepis.3
MPVVYPWYGRPVPGISLVYPSAPGRHKLGGLQAPHSKARELPPSSVHGFMHHGSQPGDALTAASSMDPASRLEAAPARSPPPKGGTVTEL